ncbi:YtxH domain-containing protein [Hymenobacter sp. BT18]|uniref:YtxH domain-containing protein n=1 Tax=Hymenobacter sp. BT18 TaxID=2835648 RepID=UPI00143ECEAC|nr:YtxH domain-containing protein [Hymenobacter sp. BT18]QIX62502.1 YtxH domain-containing protein [Hymenobacter sp. BT18]
MKDDKGKIILSLLAGASAGVIAGLLLAPETGDETRAGLRQSASRFSDDLSKLLKEGLSRLNDLKTGGVSAEHSSDRSAADSLLNDLDSTALGGSSLSEAPAATTESGTAPTPEKQGEV